MFKVRELKLTNVNGIENLTVPFSEGLNVICGSNGVGKTTIIEAIGQTFSLLSVFNLKRRAKSDKGEVKVIYSHEGVQRHAKYDLTSFSSAEKDPNHGAYQLACNIFYLSSDRALGYQNLQNLSRDPDINETQLGGRIITNTFKKEIKNWLTGRTLFSTHEKSLTDQQRDNLILAKECFSILEESISFSHIESSTYDIYVSSDSGEIPFEYLSSGYKSTLVILLGIIKDIEYRFKNKPIRAREFEGLILIDEIDLHLHPVWQASLATSIQKIFPKAQIIATTHSPHVLQICKGSEIIALHLDEEKKVAIKCFASQEHGFQGWNVEEILFDVMGMDTVRSPLFKATMKSFEDALAQENASAVLKSGTMLREMLHPGSYLNKLISLQMSSYKEASID